MNELQQIIARWVSSAQGTLKLMRSLPAGAYDFRPDPGARSIGELAWHLAEVDAYVSFGLESGRFGQAPPGIERPNTIAELAPAYETVHRDAVARVRRLSDSDLDKEVRYFDGRLLSVRDLLWERLLLHAVHHRAQLGVLCRLAGGVAPSLAGPNREETPALRERLKAEAAAAG